MYLIYFENVVDLLPCFARGQHSPSKYNPILQPSPPDCAQGPTSRGRGGSRGCYSYVPAAVFFVCDSNLCWWVPGVKFRPHSKKNMVYQSHVAPVSHVLSSGNQAFTHTPYWYKGFNPNTLCSCDTPRWQHSPYEWGLATRLLKGKSFSVKFCEPFFIKKK